MIFATLFLVKSVLSFAQKLGEIFSSERIDNLIGVSDQIHILSFIE